MARISGLVFAAILGCSGARPAPEPDVPVAGLPPRPERAASAPERSTSRSASAAGPPRDPRPPTARRGGPPGLSRRVDLDLARAPLAEAFRFLADAAQVDLVVSEGVQGEVTLRLRRVTVRDAIAAIAATGDLTTEWRGGILWVHASE